MEMGNILPPLHSYWTDRVSAQIGKEKAEMTEWRQKVSMDCEDMNATRRKH